jgi:Tfp pilus assembly protein PilO
VIRERSEQLRAKQDYVVSGGSMAAAIEAAQDELERTEAYNATWSAAVPPQGDLAAAFGKLNALVVAAGATPTRFDPEPAAKMARLCKVPVAVGCSGSFAQISQFLYDLESLPQVLWIDRLQIEKSRKDGEAAACEINLVIFADNSGKSDQVNIAEWPIKEETDFQRRLSASVR